MSKFCCITDVLWFMIKEAEKMMKVSVHEDYFFIFRDVLLLLTAKEPIKWMIENNYFHRWLLPMDAFQCGIPYSVRPVGNSPEFMTLYNIINREILHSFIFHCVLSRFVLYDKLCSLSGQAVKSRRSGSQY